MKVLDEIAVPGVRRYIPARHRASRRDLHRYLTSLTRTGEPRVEALVRRVRREAYEVGEYPRWFAIPMLIRYEHVWPTLAMLLESVSLDAPAAAIRKMVEELRRKHGGRRLAEARPRLAADGPAGGGVSARSS